MSETKNLVVYSTVKRNTGDSKDGYVEATLQPELLPSLKDDEVLIRIEAVMIHPSDLMLLFAFGDYKTLTTSQDTKTSYPLARVDIPSKSFATLDERINVPLPVGNEGAGEVIATGSKVKQLLGKKVATFGGAMYATHKIASASSVIELLPGTSPKEASAAFINPLTVLGMLYTLRESKYSKGLIHTAAASQLGQQLVKACKSDNIPLINIVRKNEQVELLKKIGAKYVLNSSDSNFLKELEDAIAETGAYIAFDATGGGELAGQILVAMEKAARRGKEYSRYGTDQMKQIYSYGALDTTPHTIPRGAIGWQWGINGWLVTTHYLNLIGSEEKQAAFGRIAKEIKTTFAITTDTEISLSELLDKETILKYGQLTTGTKYVINPSKESASKK